MRYTASFLILALLGSTALRADETETPPYIAPDYIPFIKELLPQGTAGIGKYEMEAVNGAELIIPNITGIGGVFPYPGPSIRISSDLGSFDIQLYVADPEPEVSEIWTDDTPLVFNFDIHYADGILAITDRVLNGSLNDSIFHSSISLDNLAYTGLGAWGKSPTYPYPYVLEEIGYPVQIYSAPYGLPDPGIPREGNTYSIERGTFVNRSSYDADTRVYLVELGLYLAPTGEQTTFVLGKVTSDEGLAVLDAIHSQEEGSTFQPWVDEFSYVSPYLPLNRSYTREDYNNGVTVPWEAFSRINSVEIAGEVSDRLLELQILRPDEHGGSSGPLKDYIETFELLTVELVGNDLKISTKLTDEDLVDLDFIDLEIPIRFKLAPELAWNNVPEVAEDKENPGALNGVFDFTHVPVRLRSELNIMFDGFKKTGDGVYRTGILNNEDVYHESGNWFKTKALGWFFTERAYTSDSGMWLYSFDSVLTTDESAEEEGDNQEVDPNFGWVWVGNGLWPKFYSFRQGQWLHYMGDIEGRNYFWSWTTWEPGSKVPGAYVWADGTRLSAKAEEEEASETHQE